ncbi:MAG: ComF family protein [Firmicutes bacterium]|nr:ComF family protein [Bacillota bacterium]
MYYFETGESIITRMAETVTQWLFPMATYCLCCGKYINGSRSYCICDHCIQRITWGNVEINLDEEAKHLGRPSAMDSARACMKYGLYERRLIFDLKYDGLTYVSRAIANIMHDRIITDMHAAEQLSSADFIIPVPVHKEKEKQRGFNQAEKMSHHLARRLHRRHLPDALVRQKQTAAQRSITGQERYANMEGAFLVNPKEAGRVAGKNIILIDDVYTSGATAHACASALKGAGAKEVHFMGLATGNDFADGFFGLEKVRINS